MVCLTLPPNTVAFRYYNLVFVWNLVFVFWYFRLNILPAHNRPEVGRDKAVQFPIEHRFRIAGFIIGPVVFDHFIRMKHITSDLVAPTGFNPFAFQYSPFLGLLLQFHLQNPGIQDFYGDSFVLKLTAFRLAGHDDTGGDMGDTDGAADFLHILAAGAAAAESIDF